MGTKYGLRFKSTIQRGGVIENIYLNNIEMNGVTDPFVVDLNWLPTYSTSKLPKEYNPDSIPSHWKKLLLPVDPKIGTPKFRNIFFTNITSTKASTCVKAEGIETGTIDGFHFKNVHFQGKLAGKINWANDWSFENFSVIAENNVELSLKNTKNIKLEK